MKRLATIAIVLMLSLFVFAILATSGVSWMKWSSLSFGDDIQLSGAEFGQKTLDQVSKITGLTFPDGAEGMEYAYFGSGIDDSLMAKIRIPDWKEEEFMFNLPFAPDDGTMPLHDMGHRPPWWKPQTLTGRSATEYQLPNVQYLTVIIGHEEDEVIVYVSWHCT